MFVNDIFCNHNIELELIENFPGDDGYSLKRNETEKIEKRKNHIKIKKIVKHMSIFVANFWQCCQILATFEKTCIIKKSKNKKNRL
jgi:hypothetical protein